MKDWLSKNALWAAMVVGIAGYAVFRHLHALLTPLIWLMLFFTFCKVNPRDLRLHAWHGCVLVVQLLLSGVVYYALHYLALSPRLVALWGAETGETVAQGVMMCLIMPTATAAPIIAGKLGGSIQNLTSFTLLSNFATAIVVPAWFPLVNPEAGIGFWVASVTILKRVGPLLMGPFLAAWLLRLGYDWVQRRRGSDKRFHLSATFAKMPFYLWVGTIVVLMAEITYTLVHTDYNPWVVAVLCVGSLAACLMQFVIGRTIGYHLPAANRGEDYHDVVVNPRAVPTTMAGVSRITAGQAMGQKNTTLAIWMCGAYLMPLTALAPAAYIIWQNVVNSLQIRRAAAA